MIMSSAAIECVAVAAQRFGLHVHNVSLARRYVHKGLLLEPGCGCEFKGCEDAIGLIVADVLY